MKKKILLWCDCVLWMMCDVVKCCVRCVDLKMCVD